MSCRAACATWCWTRRTCCSAAALPTPPAACWRWAPPLLPLDSCSFRTACSGAVLSLAKGSPCCCGCRWFTQSCLTLCLEALIVTLPLQLLRLDERGVRRQQAAWQLQMSAAALEALPYHLRQAASSGACQHHQKHQQPCNVAPAASAAVDATPGHSCHCQLRFNRHNLPSQGFQSTQCCMSWLHSRC